MFRKSLFPFFDAKFEVVVVFFGENGAFSFLQFCPAGGVGQDGVFDHILMDGFDERIITNRLNENRAFVVTRRGGHVHLQGETAILLQHPMVNILDGFEPCHFRVVNVVRLVVENSKLFDITNNFAQVGLAVSGFADGFRAERSEKVIAQVFVLKRRIGNISKKHPVDIREEKISRFSHNANVVLNVKCDLKIVAPVVPLETVVWQDRIVEENFQAIEIGAEPVENDDVRCDD